MRLLDAHRIAATFLLSIALLAQLAQAAPPPRGAALQGRYRDGFVLETADGDFQLKIGGNIHIDLRAYQADSRGAPHAFDIRRGRIDLRGRVHRALTFRIQPELAGSPYLRNAWIDARLGPWLHLRAGQLKVPFSSSWLTRDNNLNFIERGSSTPIYPFLDRGLLLWGSLWGGALVYNLGAFTGAGIDRDASAGDIDDSKDLAIRLFTQPLHGLGSSALAGLFLVAQLTWGKLSDATDRFETGGLRSANYATALWRWRSEQTLGSDGRVTDRTTAEIDSRLRWGVEGHYIVGPVALSLEYLEHRYRQIDLYHQLSEGSAIRARQRLISTDGAIRSFSGWVAVFVTAERKQLDNGGWRQPSPRRPLGAGGLGAIELLARYSYTSTDERLFDNIGVDGYDVTSADVLAGYDAALPGAGNSVTAAILDGAHEVHEATVGVNWTLNSMLRIQLNSVLLWAPARDRNGDGESDNLLLSGAKSNQADPNKKSRKTRWENALLARLVLKI